MKQSRLFIIAIFTGILLTLSFPPIPLPLLAWIAFVPLLFALEQNPKKPLLLIYLTFLVYHGGANWWIGSWQPKADPFLLLSGIVLGIVHPVFFMVPMVIYRFIRRKMGLNVALWMFPFIWTSFEWLHSLGDLSYPWLTVGYTQIYNHLWVQIADLAGVWGVSFIVILINVLFFRILLLLTEGKEKGVSMRETLTAPTFYRFAIPLIILMVVPYLYGFVRVGDFNHNKLYSENKKIKFALIQPDVNPWEKWSNDAFSQITKHQHIMDSLYRAAGGYDMAVWSETAIPFFNLDLNSKHDFSIIQDYLDRRRISLLTGFSDLYIYKKGEKWSSTSRFLFGDSSLRYIAYNAAVLLNPGTKVNNNEIYHKMRLTPFSERLPYADYISFALSWMEWGVGISSWEYGTEQKTLNYINNGDTVKIGTIICIESVYPGFVRNFAALGAEVYTIITNDAWFDHTPGPEQHYEIACMRAIESRRYIARCANSGVTGFITPTGATILRAPEYKSIGITASIPLLHNRSLYVITGDWLPVLSTILALSGIIIGIFRRKKKNFDNRNA